MKVLAPKLQAIRIQHDGIMVQLILDGKLVLNVPYEQALAISDALRKHGKQAEELAHAERLIQEEAVLMRSGAPFSLTANPDIKQEAGKEAAWGKVRKYLPNRIRERMVYPPIVKKKL